MRHQPCRPRSRTPHARSLDATQSFHRTVADHGDHPDRAGRHDRRHGRAGHRRAHPSPAPPSALAAAVNAADAAAAAGLDALAKGPGETYERRAVTPWLGGLYSVAYDRSYRGLPVVGGDAVVLADSQGKVRGLQSAATGPVGGSITPQVSAANAEKTARTKLAAVDSVAERRLVVRVKDGASRLAWETVLKGRTESAPSTLHVFVDAASGEVIDSYDDVRAGTINSKWNGPGPLTISTTNSGGSYSLRDPNRPGLTCSDYSSGQVFSKSSDSWGTGNPSSKETGCADAMWAAQKEWDMLRDWLGRNGHNGNGGSWPVKVGLNDVNAYWDGSSVSIGHNQNNEWIAAQDVVGHEFGHGIDQYTSAAPTTRTAWARAPATSSARSPRSTSTSLRPTTTPTTRSAGRSTWSARGRSAASTSPRWSTTTRTATPPPSPAPRCTRPPAR